MNDKVKHVLAARQSRRHHCHWPGCNAQVPPAMWGCRKHWFKLPKNLRDLIWMTYKPGQEDSLTPSREYVLAAQLVQKWIILQDSKPQQGKLPTEGIAIKPMSTIHSLLEKWAEAEGYKPDLLIHHLKKLELEDKLVPKLYSKDLGDSGTAREILDLQSIAVKNLKGVEARELEIKPGITMIYGPNDSGKSTFLDGLELALKGARGEAVPALMRAGADEMEVILKATACVIDRTYTRKVATRGKKAGDVTYEHSLVASIDGTKDNKTEKAEALIRSWCEVDLDFVIRCSMVRQGHLADVLQEEASKRQELFFRLLALDAADETRAAISEVSKKVAAKKGVQQAVIEPAEKQIAVLRAKIEKMPPLDQMKTRLAELEAVTGGSGASRVDKEARLSLIKRAVQQQEKFRTLHAQFTAKTMELNKSPALFLEVQDMAPKQAHAEFAVRNLLRQVGGGEAAIEVVMSYGKAIKHEGTFPGSQHPLGKETKDALLTVLKAQHRTLTETLEKAKGALQEADSLLTHLSGERLRMAAIAAGKVAVQASVATLHVITGHLEIVTSAFDMKGALADIELLEASIGAEAGDPKLIEEVAAWRGYLADYESILVQIKALERTVVQAKATPDDAYDPEQLEILELAFSKKGMPLWIARGHVGRVNAIAAEIAAGDRYRYELGPDLDVLILDGDKTISPRAASGSSRQRGALVILVSLALYLQELAQIKIPFLWVDEIPFQDEANQELLVEMLKNIGKRVPKLIFGASDWHSYEGKFDHQIGLTPSRPRGVTDVAIGLLKEADKAPAVKKYAEAPPLSKIETPAMDAVEKMAAAHADLGIGFEMVTPAALPAKAPKLETFDALEDRLDPLPDPKPWDGQTKVDPLEQTVPVTANLDADDPF